MAKNYFKSYIWLLETLRSRGPITLTEIKRLWMNSAVNDCHTELAPRTFSNHIAAIRDVFGVNIVCDRRDNTYHIENEEDIGGNGLRNWMLDALGLNSLLNESAGLKGRILFEDVPSGRKFLSTVIQAIRDGRKLDVRYRSYRKSEEERFVAEPWFLKEFKRRWYLIAYKGDKDGPHTLALDRMLDVNILQAGFELPKDFSAEEYFAGIYGCRVYPGMKPERVLLKVSAMQSQYFRSLPLHSSQEEIETHEDFSIFSYFLTTDYDFHQDILSFGDAVEVLEPEELRKRLLDIAAKLITIYGETDMSYKSFREKILKNLGKYNKWGPGQYNGSGVYPHIANIDGRRKNDVVLEIIKLDGVNEDMFRKPHRYAHHLNSSQVVCYEFFRPLIDNADKIAEMLDLMEVPSEHFINSQAEFEKEFDDGEGTNFDFYLSSAEDTYNLYVEVKYTEQGFGSCKGDSSHKKKFKDVYKKSIEASPCIEESQKTHIDFPTMQRFYQLFRNVLKIKGDDDYVVFLFPEKNPIVKAQFDAFRDTFLSEYGKNHVKGVYWEKLIGLMGKGFLNKFFFYAMP